MDWLSPVSALLGALVGACASFFGSRLALKQQLEDARLAREDAERKAVVGALSTTLAALLEQAAKAPQDASCQRAEKDPGEYRRVFAAKKAWDVDWQPLVHAARIAALEVRQEDVRNRLITALKYLADWRDLEYADHGRIRAWVLRGVIDHLIESVFAWRRGEQLPDVSQIFITVAEAWQLKQEEKEELYQAAVENEDRLHAEALAPRTRCARRFR